jgi:hypothetical protein
MLIGNTEISREQLPSFVDFANNPKHLYSLMQDQLNQGLQVQALQQQNQMQRVQAQTQGQ